MMSKTQNETRAATAAMIGWAGRCAILCLAMGLGLGAAQGAEPAGDAAVQQTRASLEKWVQTNRAIAAEKRRLVETTAMLEKRIDLVQGEIDELRAKTREADQALAEIDVERAELAEENDTLKATTATLTEAVRHLEARTQALLARLPAPVRDHVRPLSQQIPEALAETRLSLSQRFVSVLGILDAVNKAHRQISVTPEVHTLADGSAVEVTAVYVGIAQGYYTGAKGTVAGQGSGGTQGWVWRPMPVAAEAVAQVIAILNNEQVARFVPLPLTIDYPGSVTP